MATVRMHLDTRTARKDGTFPVKISVFHNGKTTFINFGVYVMPQHWDEELGRVIGGPSRTYLNNIIFQKLDQAEDIVLRLSKAGKLPDMGIGQLREVIQGGGEAKGHRFKDAFREFMGLKTNPSTRKLYERTLSKLSAFCPELDTLPYEKITRNWLMEFDAFLTHTTPKRNARNIHLRNIRAVFNYAIDSEYTTAYPFRRFKIRPEETRKRSLTVEQLRLLRDFPCEEYQIKYRDIFLLMFYLIGINPIDLLLAKKSDVVDGRLEYRRAKTGKLYSIKIEPEAQEIIDRYAGHGEYLIDVMERYSNQRDFRARLGHSLKLIGPLKRVGRGGKKVIEPLFPDLSAYWARHSWATIAYSLDVPKETISEALGHEIGSRITSIYIQFDRRKVDRANRRVIDWVLYGKTETGQP